MNQHQNGQPKPIIFLAHGLFSSSASYCWGPANKSIAYILADAGRQDFKKFASVPIPVFLSSPLCGDF